VGLEAGAQECVVRHEVHQGRRSPWWRAWARGRWLRDGPGGRASWSRSSGNSAGGNLEAELDDEMVEYEEEEVEESTCGGCEAANTETRAQAEIAAAGVRR
jgi:hypothetical protein